MTMADNGVEGAVEDKDGKGKKGKKGKEKKGGKSNLVPAIIIAVGLILGGRFMGGGNAPAPAAASATPASEEGTAKEKDCKVYDIKEEPEEGAVVKLDPITINLRDGHFAKVGIALTLSASKDAKKFKEEGGPYKALDRLIALIQGRDVAEFASSQAVEQLKEKLAEEVRPLYECKVLEVLFTEFVTQ
jgi:flagellar FliL protein